MTWRQALGVVVLLAGAVGVYGQTPARPAGPSATVATAGMVVSQDVIASTIGANVLKDGGTAIDAAIATAFALAVVHPTAGNIGGGGFLVYRPASGPAVTYDFREMAPAGASPTMFLVDGQYSAARHHDGYLSVGVPGTVAGLHMAWREHGKLPWARLLQPAIVLARDGFVLTEGLARSISRVLPQMAPYPASVAQFSRGGAAMAAGDVWRQPDLARTLGRIAERGPAGFYQGETADLLVRDMAAHGGLITHADLQAYVPVRRDPVRGQYRGYEVLSMPPVSSGGVALLEMLNILEGYDLRALGHGTAATGHLVIEAMRRAYADRARYLGDPGTNPEMPIATLISKPYAAERRRSIREDRASVSSPTSFDWTGEPDETTHLSVVDAARNAVSMTYTLEGGYGAKIVAPGTGFLLNNEMGDFNAGPGLTTADGLIGTTPNLARPGKRMLSSMTPTILAKDGQLRMVTGSPGGRTIINTVLHTILNVVDFDMDAQAAVDAGRFHHQWLPDRVLFEPHAWLPDVAAVLGAKGHTVVSNASQGVAEVIVVDQAGRRLTGGVDRRAPDGGAVGY